MKNQYVDVNAINTVIGSVFRHPDILEMEDIFPLNEEDFPEMFHKVLYGTLVNLYVQGAQSFNVEMVENYLSKRPKWKAVYDQQNGPLYIEAAIDKADFENFEYYHGRIKKMTLLRAFTTFGMDLSELYDPNNIFDIKKKERQEAWLDSTTLQEIADKIADGFDEIVAKHIDNFDGESAQAGDGLEDLILGLQESPDLGIPMYSRLINSILMGARLGKFYLRSAPTGVGKAIPVDTELPTMSGFKKASDIKIGDYLIDRTGKKTKVLGVYPQKEKKEVYNMTFKDGRVGKSCSEHLWTYWYRTHRGWTTRTETTEEIMKRGLYNTTKQGNKDYKFKIDINKAIEYETKNLPIDPYVFGAMLGDGSFRRAWTETPNGKLVVSNGQLVLSSGNIEIPNIIANIMNWSPIKNSTKNYSYSFKDEYNNKVQIIDFLKEIPELIDCYSLDKTIPEIYLMGDIEQRQALLQGLLDTDGSIDTKGRVKFFSNSEQLAQSVLRLIRSLGYVGKIQSYEREGRNVEYIVNIQCNREHYDKLFRVSRKYDIAIEYQNNIENFNREMNYEVQSIIDIQPTGEYVDMVCFYVDNEEHLFLTEDFIVTHNTRTLIADACTFSCSEIYNIHTKQWEANPAASPTLFIATEQSKQEIQTMLLAFVANIDETAIKNQIAMTEEELARAMYGIEILKKAQLRIETMSDFSLKEVENTIKRNIRKYGVEYVLFDYIHTSMKILSEIASASGGARLPEHSILFLFSVEMKKITEQYDVFIISATQLNGDYKEAEVPDQNLLRGERKSALTYLILVITRGYYILKNIM